MSIVAIIPARSGSKNVPGKNIKLLGGIPLFAYSILVAKMMPEVERVIVSTDSKEYATIANKFGAETPFIRPDEISGDKSSDLDFFLHALRWFKLIEGDIPDLLLHLRPTTPLRDPKILSKAVKQFLTNKNATSLRSGHLASESPFKWFLKDENGYFKGLLDDLTPERVNLPRQMFPTVYVPDGYIDIVRSSVILNDGSLHGNKMIVFESPHCIEVDTLEDFKLLEYQVQKEGSTILEHFNSIK